MLLTVKMHLKRILCFPFQNEIQTLYQHVCIEDNKMERNIANLLTSQFGERTLALFIISLCSLNFMKVLNHSAQLVSAMVDYRGSSSKLQEQDPFSLSFEEPC